MGLIWLILLLSIMISICSAYLAAAAGGADDSGAEAEGVAEAEADSEGLADAEGETFAVGLLSLGAAGVMLGPLLEVLAVGVSPPPQAAARARHITRQSTTAMVFLLFFIFILYPFYMLKI
jgi:hypothetical protein